MKVEFKWIIETTFNWPGRAVQRLESPLFQAEKDQGTKWGLTIQRHPYGTSETQELLFLFLVLEGSSSASELKIATKYYITDSDEKDGKILHQKTIDDPVSMDINYGDDVLSEGGFPIGNRKDYLKIPSVAVRIYLEYEKETITTSCIANLASSSLKENALKSSWSSGFGALFTNQSAATSVS